MATSPATVGFKVPRVVPVECGKIRLSEWSNFRARALGILRKSSNQRKCLDLMRAKARGLLGLDLGGEKDALVLKEEGEESDQPAFSPTNCEEQLDVWQEGISEKVLLEMPQLEFEAISKDECKLVSVGSFPWTASNGLFFTVSDTQALVTKSAGFTDTW